MTYLEKTLTKIVEDHLLYDYNIRRLYVGEKMTTT